MQYGEDDLRFITRLLGEVGIWFRFSADTRLHIDVAEFCDSQQGYEKGLTLPSVPPSGQQSAGVDAVWRWHAATVSWSSRSVPATTTTARRRRT